jgi:hypothetical protein
MSNPLGNPSESLRHRVDDFTEILYEDGTFTIRDMDGGGANNQNRHVLRLMAQYGAIEAVGYEDANKSKRRKKYQWKDYQEELQEYVENRDELPCGCRAHIPPEQNGNTYHCKFCGSAHSREVIENAL